MPYYYSTTSQQNSNGTANTDLLLASWWTAAASSRCYIQKAVFGSYATPADNAIRLRLTRATTATTVVAGTAFTPTKIAGDSPAAVAVNAQTVPTFTGAITDNAHVQVAFNQRGTAMWAAFNADEAIGIVGAGTSTDRTAGASLYLLSQSTGTTVPVNFSVLSSE